MLMTGSCKAQREALALQNWNWKLWQETEGLKGFPAVKSQPMIIDSLEYGLCFVRSSDLSRDGISELYK